MTISQETDVARNRIVHRITVKHGGEERSWIYPSFELAAAFIDGVFALGTVVDAVLVSANGHETSFHRAHERRRLARTRERLVTRR